MGFHTSTDTHTLRETAEDGCPRFSVSVSICLPENDNMQRSHRICCVAICSHTNRYSQMVHIYIRKHIHKETERRRQSNRNEETVSYTNSTNKNPSPIFLNISFHIGLPVKAFFTYCFLRRPMEETCHVILNLSRAPVCAYVCVCLFL